MENKTTKNTRERPGFVNMEATPFFSGSRVLKLISKIASMRFTVSVLMRSSATVCMIALHAIALAAADRYTFTHLAGTAGGIGYRDGKASDARFYEPGPFGFEKEIAKRMAWWEELKRRAADADEGTGPRAEGPGKE